MRSADSKWTFYAGPHLGAENLPVLIFVHGDSYEHGSGNAYDFSLFSSLGGVIVVTLNYRLGVLGRFLHETFNSFRLLSFNSQVL